MLSQLSKFAYAMNASASTSNGAVSLSTPDPMNTSSGRVSLFFKSVRGLSNINHYKFLSDSDQESTLDTFLLSFNIRDCRGGKGEREIGRRGLIWLFINHPEKFMKIVDLIPEYGRWDDLLCFFPSVLNLTDIKYVRENYFSTIENNNYLNILCKYQQQIVKIISDKIIEDHARMIKGESCSLAAKWAPTEGDSLDRSHNTFKTLADSMGISPRVLRKTYLTPLRLYIKIVERYMCDGKWSEIDYNKVPSCAMKRLKKSFKTHDEDRFNGWSEALKKGDPTVAKVNGKQLQPHELIKEMRTNSCADSVCEAQWKIMEDECVKNGSLDNDLVVVDTSSSMTCNNYLPLDVACAMGLLISKCSVGKFNNHVISFDSNPKFTIIREQSIYKRYRQLLGINWGGSTNIQSTFRLILDRGKTFGLKQEDMPKRLWIISDMQFNQAEGYYGVTNFQAIEKMYEESGYTRPQIIFWNVEGSSNDFPVSVDDNGTALISGFSTSIMKSILNGDENFTSYQIMRAELDNERLKPIRLRLAK